jgi:predicted nucleic-acid-binding protein
MVTIAVDTNILVRLLTQDDLEQYQKSVELFQENNVYICDTVILETEWVLRFAYEFKPQEINQGFKKLFGLTNVYLSNVSKIYKALEWHESGLDFADAIHLANNQHCSYLYTFDQKFCRQAKNITPCEVKKL